MSFDGVGKYRIGELAEMANVTKRTIDYYTNMGLLKAERNASNYRYYTQESLEILRFIESCKQKQLSLHEIRESINDESKKNQTDILLQTNEVEEKIKNLKNNVDELLPLLEKLNDSEKKLILNRLSPESVTLIHSLLMLLA
ncbi:MerR family transcriptional regulator [Bacillus sp. JJ1533]|uniref:MerR family transcriptional regulator n=1 Tax=Bacillus sp. JJ1533 TaxID=3122959 RepID=UPI002FFE0610